MATRQVMQHCGVCQKQTLFVQQYFSAATHILLTLITGGFWALGLVLYYVAGGWLIEPIRKLFDRGRCTVCGTNGQAIAAQSTGSKKIPVWAWAAIVVVALGVLGSFLPPASSTPGQLAASTHSPTEASAATSEVTTIQQNWLYATQPDRMRDAIDGFAETTSVNAADLGFPYSSARMSITLRKSARYGRDIYLAMHTGQFLCRFEGCTIHARFDDGPIQTYSMNEASGGQSDVLFIENQSRFLGALRRARHVTIEAQFFNHGAEQFDFDVSGLEWH